MLELRKRPRLQWCTLVLWKFRPHLPDVIVKNFTNLAVLSRKTGDTQLIWRPSFLKYNLSKGLQSKELSAAQGQHMATVTVDTLKGLRCDECFISFWGMVIEKQRTVDVNEPVLPRKCKAPHCYEVGTSSGNFPASIEDHYHSI